MGYILDYILDNLIDDLELYSILNDINELEKKELNLIINLFISYLRTYYKNNNNYQLMISFDYHLHEYFIKKYNFQTESIYNYKKLKTIEYFSLDKSSWTDVDYIKYYLNKNFCNVSDFKSLSIFMINSFYDDINKSKLEFYKIKNYKEYPYNLMIDLFDFDLWVKDQGGVFKIIDKYKKII